MTDHVQHQHRAATVERAVSTVAPRRRRLSSQLVATAPPVPSVAMPFVSAGTRIRRTTAPAPARPFESEQASRISRADRSQTVIRRFPIRANKVPDPTGKRDVKDRPVLIAKVLRRTSVDDITHIDDLVKMIEDRTLDAEDLMMTFTSAFADAASTKINEDERSRRSKLVNAAWSRTQEAYLRTCGKVLEPPKPAGAKKASEVRDVKAKAVPTSVALTMPRRFEDEVGLACEAIKRLNPNLEFNVERVARTLYWFVHEAPHEDPDPTTTTAEPDPAPRTPSVGHSTYRDFPLEVASGLERWHHLGVNLATVLAKPFGGLNDQLTEFSAGTAGSVRGKVAEIRDAIRSGPRSAAVQSVESGDQKYSIKDTVRGDKSVPAPDLKAAAGKDLDTHEFTADVDRIERLGSGDELWCEVKFSALTAANKHRDVAQLDRLCATVKRADRVAPLSKGCRIPVISIVELEDFDRLWIRSASQHYVNYGVHLMVGGHLWTPEQVRAAWDRHAAARAKRRAKAPAEGGATADGPGADTRETTESGPKREEQERILEDLALMLSRKDMAATMDLAWRALDARVPPEQLVGALCALLAHPDWQLSGLKLLDRLSRDEQVFAILGPVGETLATLPPPRAIELLHRMTGFLTPFSFGQVLLALVKVVSPKEQWVVELLPTFRSFFREEILCPTDLRRLVGFEAVSSTH